MWSSCWHSRPLSDGWTDGFHKKKGAVDFWTWAPRRRQNPATSGGNAEARKGMRLTLGDDFRSLAQQIIAFMASEPRWREFEADDLFQSPRYRGGYDIAEEAYTFSYYDMNGGEWWFQLSPSDIGDVVAGRLVHVEARPPS